MAGQGRRDRNADGAPRCLIAGAAAFRDQVRAGDPARLARAVLLAAHAFGLSAATMATDEVIVTDLDEELVDLIRSYLA